MKKLDPATNSTPCSPSGESPTLALTLTLDPLLDDGAAALAPDTPAGITHISLSQIAVVWHNAFNEVTISKADDLFACAAKDGRFYDPIPKGAELIQATLDFLFEGAAKPHAVGIVPPHTLTLEEPSDAPRILSLLARRGFS